MRLKDNVAVITGGTSGIGLAIAERFVQEGAALVVAARNEKRNKAAEEKLRELGNTGYSVVCDVCDEAQVDALMKGAKEKLGRIDIFVGSAGAFPAKPFLKMTAKDWSDVLHLNLDSAFYCAKAVAPIMTAQNYGRIIFISSAQGLRGIPLMAHYSAAKGGVIAFARCIGAELGTCGITVNTIAAGLTLTPPVETLHTQEEQDIVAASIPNKRLGNSEDLAGLAALLASPEGKHITCQTIAVDGGMTQAQAVFENLYQDN
jgi:NAD(P)-dependent dehydrogenase (short-subunit alcohol dehydrogenase family)